MKRNIYKDLGLLFITVAIVAMSSLLILNKWVLDKFITTSYVQGFFKSEAYKYLYELPRLNERIFSSQIKIIVLSIVLFVIGYKIYMSTTITSLQSKLFRCGLVFSVILFIEFVLRITPLLSTTQLLNASVPFEPAVFSFNKIPAKDFNVMNLDGSIKEKIRGGYNGNTFSTKKADDETRIVFLGGSFIFSDFEWASHHNHNWIERIGEALKIASGKNIICINAGVPAHASFDCIGRLYSEIHQFEPDYVVLCCEWNDITNFTNYTETNSLLRIKEPQTDYTHEYPSRLQTFAEKSQLFMYIKTAFFNGLLNKIKDANKNSMEVANLKESYHVNATKQFQLDYELFVDICKNINAQPIIFTEPRLTSINNDSIDKTKISYGLVHLNHKGLLKAYKQCDGILKNVAIQKGITFWDFAQELNSSEYFVDEVHLNKKGADKAVLSCSRFLSGIIKK